MSSYSTACVKALLIAWATMIDILRHLPHIYRLVMALWSLVQKNVLDMQWTSVSVSRFSLSMCENGHNFLNAKLRVRLQTRARDMHRRGKMWSCHAVVPFTHFSYETGLSQYINNIKKRKEFLLNSVANTATTQNSQKKNKKFCLHWLKKMWQLTLSDCWIAKASVNHNFC